MCNYILDEVRFQCEYAIQDHHFSGLRLSTTAVAAIFNSLDVVERTMCRTILKNLLVVMKYEEFAPQEELFDAKVRLKKLVERDACCLNKNK